MVTKRAFKIISEDEETFECDRDTVNLSGILKVAIEDCGDDTTGEIPVPVKGKVLAKVIEWCEYNQGTNDNGLDRDSVFVQETASELCDIMVAASYLEINALYHLCAKALAGLITGKSARQLNANLNLFEDFERDDFDAITEENGGII